MTVSTEFLPPRYRSPTRIGHGGMGEIFRATDESLGRAVAIKILVERFAEDASRGRRSLRRGSLASRTR